MRINGGYTRTAKILVVVSIAVAVVFGFVIGGLGVIIDTNKQSERNFEAIQESKRVDTRQATILRILLATSGCKDKDTPGQCAKKQEERSIREGKNRLVSVDCIVRSIHQGDSKFETDRKCSV